MESDLDAIFSGEPYEAKYKPIGAKWWTEAVDHQALTLAGSIVN
jgi:hypothetical protein